MGKKRALVARFPGLRMFSPSNLRVMIDYDYLSFVFSCLLCVVHLVVCCPPFHLLSSCRLYVVILSIVLLSIVLMFIVYCSPLHCPLHWPLYFPLSIVLFSIIRCPPYRCPSSVVFLSIVFLSFVCLLPFHCLLSSSALSVIFSKVTIMPCPCLVHECHRTLGQ